MPSSVPISGFRGSVQYFNISVIIEIYFHIILYITYYHITWFRFKLFCVFCFNLLKPPGASSHFQIADKPWILLLIRIICLVPVHPARKVRSVPAPQAASARSFQPSISKGSLLLRGQPNLRVVDCHAKYIC